MFYLTFNASCNVWQLRLEMALATANLVPWRTIAYYNWVVKCSSADCYVFSSSNFVDLQIESKFADIDAEILWNLKILNCNFAMQLMSFL